MMTAIADGPYGSLTVNLPQVRNYDEDFSFVDTNNFPGAEALIERLGIGQRMNVVARSGFCTYPLYKFDRQAIARYGKEM